MEFLPLFFVLIYKNATNSWIVYLKFLGGEYSKNISSVACKYYGLIHVQKLNYQSLLCLSWAFHITRIIEGKVTPIKESDKNKMYKTRKLIL